MRGTLSLYYKHVLENNHRENVKKLCNENRYEPSIYDQAIHLAFHNNVTIEFLLIDIVINRTNNKTVINNVLFVLLFCKDKQNNL